MMLLEMLRRIWYEREDYIEFTAGGLLQELRRQDTFKDLPMESFISINPSSKEYVVADTLTGAIASGCQKWEHREFYCAPVNSESEPRPQSRLGKYLVQRRGERIFSDLKRQGRLEEVLDCNTDPPYIAIEIKRKEYVLGSSFNEVLHEGAKRGWEDKNMYARPL